MTVQHRVRWRGLIPLAIVLASTAADGADLEVVPSVVELQGNFDQAQLIVSQIAAADDDDRQHDLTHAAVYQSSSPAVVSVSDSGRLRAMANGDATVTVTVGQHAQSVPVHVRGIEAEPKISFTGRVVPILSKAGCNAAACHASQYGKGGFKLSVFGYAPEEDYDAIVHAREARRVNFIEPHRSLVLLKPTRAIPHGGNRRLEPGSVDYQIILTWLGAGAPPPKADDPAIVDLEVYPRRRVGEPGTKQQLRAIATYSDGRTRDVTPWAKFDSMDESVATVSPQGLTENIGRGQAAVMVRFGGQADIFSAVSPYAVRVDLSGWKDNNYVDQVAAAKFRQLGITPSPLCDDATFLRRVYLDALGTMPAIDETVAFLDSTVPDKRQQLIDRLLGLTDSPTREAHNSAYAAFWSLKWADLIRSNSAKIGTRGMWALHNWLKQSLHDNTPFDRFVEELLTARGSQYANGPANYFMITDNPSDLGEATSQLFLGVRLQCAKCHHHPYEKYSQDDYYRFAACFARVGTKQSTDFGIFGGEKVVTVLTEGEVRNPRTGNVMPATPLEGQPLGNALDPRAPLADWLTSPENPFFAHNVVNRYVAYLFGRGLVEPVDDLRATNPPSNPELMDALARQFVRSGFNLKHLMRDIMSSRLYQLDSQPTAGNAADSRFYSHYRVKRLSAEPLLDAIDYATSSPTKFEHMPLGIRAIELPDVDYNNYFLRTFGKPKRASVCECERMSDPNLSQALTTLNGDILANKINDSKGRVARLLDAHASFDSIVNELYLATLCRRPNEPEVQALRSFQAQTPDPKIFYQDLLWSLINSKQFLFVR